MEMLREWVCAPRPGSPWRKRQEIASLSCYASGAVSFLTFLLEASWNVREKDALICRKICWCEARVVWTRNLNRCSIDEKLSNTLCAPVYWAKLGWTCRFPEQLGNMVCPPRGVCLVAQPALNASGNHFMTDEVQISIFDSRLKRKNAFNQRKLK